MKALALVLPLLLATGGGAAQDAPTTAPGRKPSLDMADPAIQAAVRAIVAEHKGPALAASGPALRGDPSHAAFARRMDEAAVPGCLQPDALKHAPPKLGPVALGGLFALPFWAGAALSGKCR